MFKMFHLPFKLKSRQQLMTFLFQTSLWFFFFILKAIQIEYMRYSEEGDEILWRRLSKVWREIKEERKEGATYPLSKLVIPKMWYLVYEHQLTWELLEIQNLGPRFCKTPDLLHEKLWEVRSSNLYFNKHSSWFWNTLKFENHWLNKFFFKSNKNI